jgi:signal peptidase
MTAPELVANQPPAEPTESVPVSHEAEPVQVGDPEARPGSARRAVARLIGAGLLWALGGLLLGLCLAVSLPYLFGNRSLTVMSGSMEPTLGVGDVLIVEKISPVETRIGDVVTFRDPADPTRLITHRVRDLEIANGLVKFETKGDANTSVERWRIPSNGTIGRATYHVPKIGYALFWIRGRFGRLMFVVIPALLLGAYELWRIWRPRGEDEIEADEVEVDAA